MRSVAQFTLISMQPLPIPISPREQDVGEGVGGRGKKGQPAGVEQDAEDDGLLGAPVLDQITGGESRDKVSHGVGADHDAGGKVAPLIVGENLRQGGADDGHRHAEQEKDREQGHEQRAVTGFDQGHRVILACVGWWLGGDWGNDAGRLHERYGRWRNRVTGCRLGRRADLNCC